MTRFFSTNIIPVVELVSHAAQHGLQLQQQRGLLALRDEVRVHLHVAQYGAAQRGFCRLFPRRTDLHQGRVACNTTIFFDFTLI